MISKQRQLNNLLLDLILPTDNLCLHTHTGNKSSSYEKNGEYYMFIKCHITRKFKKNKRCVLKVMNIKKYQKLLLSCLHFLSNFTISVPNDENCTPFFVLALLLNQFSDLHDYFFVR